MKSNSKLTIGTMGRKPFQLPLTLVTSTQAILARKRSGKSYTASVQAEEMLESKQQIAVIDPTGAWWGLKSSADGKQAGYSVVVFGGDHADAPLDFRAGKAMAAALVEHGFSAIFDVGNFTTREQLQFVMDFSAELLRINREAMHVFMDEADTFAPQQTKSPLQFDCLGTVTRLVSQGGIRGVGFTMITQRSAKINWDVLSQVDILTVLRMGAPHDVKPVIEWLQSEATKEFASEVKAALPALPIGTAFIASAPLGIAARVEVRTRHTFNSGATPRPGQRRVEPKVMAQIDVEKLGKEISASVERMKAESPELLKRQIATLQAELARGGKADMGFMEEAQAAQAELVRLRAENAEIPAMQTRISRYETAIKQLSEAFSLVTDLLAQPRGKVTGPPAALQRLSPTPPPSKASPVAAAPPTGGEVKLRGKSVAMLAVCARMYPAGLTEAQVAMQSGMKRSGGTFGDYKSLLKTSGCVEMRDGLWYATAEGLRRAGTSIPSSPTNTAEVLALWMPKLRGKAKDMLTHLVSRGGDFVSYEDLGIAVGMEPKGGSFGDYLSLLRTAGLVTTQGNAARANTDVLFL